MGATTTRASGRTYLRRPIATFGILLLGIIGMVLLSKLKAEPPKKPDVVTTPLVETSEIEVESVQFDVSSQVFVSPLMQSSLRAVGAALVMGWRESIR